MSEGIKKGKNPKFMKKICVLAGVLVVLPVQAQEFVLDGVSVKKINKIKVLKKDGVALKSKKYIKDIPVSVFSIDKTVYETQGFNNVQDLTGQVSNLTPAGWDYGIGDNLEIRGLGVSYTKDGLSHSATYNVESMSPVRSLTNADSVQVIKGANGSLYGVGAVGGMINLTTKTPLNARHNSVKITLGSFQTYGVLVDYTKKHTNAISSRIIANNYSSKGWRSVTDKKMELFPSLAVKKGTSSFVIMGEISQSKNLFDSIGHPVRIYQHKGANVSSTGKINAGSGYASAYGTNGSAHLSDADKKEVEDTITKNAGFKPFDTGKNYLSGGILKPAKTDNLGTNFMYSNHYKGWNITQHGQVRNVKQSYVRIAGAYNYVDYDDWGSKNKNPKAPLVRDSKVYPYALRRAEYRRRIFKENSVDYSIDAKKDFMWGGKKHNVLIAAGIKQQYLDVKEASVYDADTSISKGVDNDNPAPYITDMRNPVLPEKDFDQYTVMKKDEYKKTNTTYFVGANDVVDINDKLTVRGGLSVIKYKQNRENSRCFISPDYVTNCRTTSSDSTGNTVNLGAVYKLTQKLNGFMGYAKGKTPHSVTGDVDTTFKTMESTENKEIGVKYSLPDNGLLTATYFQTAKKDMKYSWDTGNTDSEGAIIYSTKYDGRDYTKGFEVDLSFKPTPALFVSMTYARLNAKSNRVPGYKTITKASLIEYDMTGVAKDTFNVFSRYTLPKSMQAIKTGQVSVFGNIKHVGKRYLPGSWAVRNFDSTYLPAYTVLNMGASLEMDNQLTAIFRVNNVTNKKYYSRRLFFGGLPGAERNYMLTLEYKF